MEVSSSVYNQNIVTRDQTEDVNEYRSAMPQSKVEREQRIFKCRYGRQPARL
jgi:hypothetical protein